MDQNSNHNSCCIWKGGDLNSSCSMYTGYASIVGTQKRIRACGTLVAQAYNEVEEKKNNFFIMMNEMRVGREGASKFRVFDPSLVV